MRAIIIDNSVKIRKDTGIHCHERCKIYRKTQEAKNRYRLVIEDVKGWRIISVFIVGVREYVENLKLRIELATRKALTENILCEEQKTSQNCPE